MAEYDVDLYQTWCKSRATFPKELGLQYLTLGLVGEAGEIANKVKKILRGDYELTDAKRLELLDEAGDVAWYLAMLTAELGYSFTDVFTANYRKLNSRHERGVIKGSGDAR